MKCIRRNKFLEKPCFSKVPWGFLFKVKSLFYNFEPVKGWALLVSVMHLSHLFCCPVVKNFASFLILVLSSTKLSAKTLQGQVSPGFFSGET